MRKVHLLIALVLFLITGCDYFEGPTGPSGKNGVANITTKEFTINRDKTEIDNGTGLNKISMSSITKAVVDSGMVKVEFQAINDGWFSLPWTFGDEYLGLLESNQTIELTYGYKKGQLYIAHISNASNPSLDRSQIQEGPYKVTVIPPSSAVPDSVSGSKNKAHRMDEEPKIFFQ